jgi:hypothetical protein
MSETSTGRDAAELARGDPAIGTKVVELNGTAVPVTRLLAAEILFEPEISAHAV